jgi:hypothetical protein
MTYLRRLLCDAGLLKIVNGDPKTKNARRYSKNVAVNGKTITPMAPHRLELEIQKLLAASHYAVALPDGMPCDDLAELRTSTPVLLSFGMFQNIIYVISVLCVQSVSGGEDTGVHTAQCSLATDQCFHAVMQRLQDVILDEKQLPFSPFPYEFRNPGSGGGYVIPNNLPSPFQHESVMDVYLQDPDQAHNRSFGIWNRNMGQTKQIYWYYSQYYRAIGNPSFTKIGANVQKKSTSFFMSFSQCKDFLQDFGLLPHMFDYKVYGHLIACILASGYIESLIDDIVQNYQALSYKTVPLH